MSTFVIRNVSSMSKALPIKVSSDIERLSVTSFNIPSSLGLLDRRLMSVEEELKKDHADMQAIVDSKQKIIEAQVSTKPHRARV